MNRRRAKAQNSAAATSAVFERRASGKRVSPTDASLKVSAACLRPRRAERTFAVSSTDAQGRHPTMLTSARVISAMLRSTGLHHVRRGLYPIVDLDSLGRRDPIAFAECLLAAGDLFALQLRAKHATSREQIDIASALAYRCGRTGVPFVMNDRPDIAWLAGACGVHVGQTDVAVDDARRAAPLAAVGISTHSDDQLVRGLRDHPTYIAVGPVFATLSKHQPDPVVGLDALQRAAAAAGETPVVAIGGITLNADSVRRHGAAASAVIGALVNRIDSDLTDYARALHVQLGGAPWTP